MKLDEQLREARKASGLSQEQLASRMNMSRQGVSHWENGRTLPDAEILKQLSQILNYNFIETSTPAAAPEAAAEAPARADSAPSLAKARLWCALCLVAGIAIGGLLMPLISSLGVSGRANAPGEPSQAHIAISSSESPVMARHIQDVQAPFWDYTIIFTETAGVDFAIEQITQVMVAENGLPCVPEAFTSEEIFGEAVTIKGGKNRYYRGGFPVQSIEGLRVTISGTDAAGNRLTFEQLIPFSKRFAQ